MIVYLVRDIPAFVMYCVNGASRSSLLIESVDSMILKYTSIAESCGELDIILYIPYFLE